MTANAPTQRFQNSKEPMAKGTNPVKMWDNEDLNLLKGGQFIKIFIAFTLKFHDNMGMIKKAALVGLALTSGCATYHPQLSQVPYYQPPQRNGVAVGPFNVQPQQMVPGVVTDIVTNPVGYAVNQTGGYATSVLGQNISDPFITAQRANTFILGAFGPNNVSTSINKGLKYYRQGLGFLQNPLQTAFNYTTPWIK